MITPLQIKKAIDMRNGSGMSWEAIADVIDEDLEELVRCVEKAWGKEIPRETWGRPREAVEKKLDTLVARAGLAVEAAKSSLAAKITAFAPQTIEGFDVVFDAGPPPPKLGDGRMAVLAQKLKPGARIECMTHVEFLSLRRFLTRLGMGSEFRWIDRKEGTVKAWVLPELSARQRVMSARMKERAEVAPKAPAPVARKKRK